MTTATVPQLGSSVDIAAQNVSNAGTYDLLATISVPQARSKILITGIVGGTGPLTGFKITGAAKPGGTHAFALVDGDFNTASQRCPDATANIYTSVTGATFWLTLDLTGIQEIKIYGKSSNATTIAFEIGN